MPVMFQGFYRISPPITTWTDLAVSPAGGVLIVRHYIILNSTGAAIEVRLRVADSGSTELARIYSDVLAAADRVESKQAFIVLRDGEKLQCWQAQVGNHFLAWGGTE